MEYLSFALVAASLAAWDFGRRWVAREHAAVAMAAEALKDAKLAYTRSEANAATLSNHVDELIRLDKRQTDTAHSLSITRENQRPTAKSPVGRLSGARSR